MDKYTCDEVTDGKGKSGVCIINRPGVAGAVLK